MRLHDLTDPSFQLALMCHTVTDLADAASHSERPECAAATLEWLTAAARPRRPFTRARTELAYGEWLRRQRRAAESRPYLRSARDTFDALGTAPWSERARHELRLAGERSTERRAVAHDLLTAQELQIAQLAASGLTNREIGKRLYISHRTVGAHLAKVYAKLEVTSGVQLHDALA
ncbi:MAG TPA: LuxR C-terminal-related transcriptional regulator [Trebonia sp.]|nr:LuxR C-terminal-related transcriptional regulator [Trebonia sp.]